MKKLITTVFIALLSVSPSLLSATSAIIPSNDKMANALPAVLQKVMPSVVNIHAEGDAKPGDDPFQSSADTRPQKGHFVSIGSGVIINADKGYILTNAHVVYNADNLTITLNDGRRYKAKTIGVDVGFDIAVLQIRANNLVAVPFGDSDALKVGDLVIAIGSPFDLKQTVTSGIVSALHRSIQIEGNEDFIQTDASINMGSSGGALVDMQGNLVGLNTAILAPGGGNIGIGFAIPVSLAQNVMEQIIQYGKIQRGLLGVYIQNLTPDLANDLGASNATGAVVSQVNPASPASVAGIIEGDIIHELNGKTIVDSSQLRNAINLYRPGSNLSLAIIRNDKPLLFHATLTDAKTYKDKTDQLSSSLLAGVSMENFDQTTVNYGRVKGVQVDFVDQNSDAWSAMLRPADVITSANQQKITDLNGLQKILDKDPDHLLLHVLREDGAFYLSIP